MKTFAKVLLVISPILWLAAIWVNEYWWQLLLTGALTCFIAAAILGQDEDKDKT